MSARSMTRARVRELERSRRRNRRRAAQLSAGAAVALGAGAMFAPGAEAATLTVNSTADAPAGPCDATCTLRDAVEEANTDADVDVIAFAPAVTGEITLIEGEIPIDAGIDIQGPGSGVLRISGDANGDDLPDAGDSRIFYVNVTNGGAEGDPVSISGLTLQQGSESGSGGALQSYYADLTVSDSVLRDNVAGSTGGALYSEGRLTVDNTVFRDNLAEGSGGGALYADHESTSAENGDVTITDSTFEGNEASAGYGRGGAIYLDQYNDAVVVSRSTFTDNTANGDGGAINVYGPRDGSFELSNSTLSGNSTTESGGAVFFGNYFDSPMRVENSTVVNNSADVDGGGLYRFGGDDTGGTTDDTVVVSSTIVANNDALGAGNDIADRTVVGTVGTFEIGHSLIEDPTGAAITAAPAGSNIVGVDPMLGPLADNGGPTLTHLPTATNSPVVNAGVDNGLATDQRGFARNDDLGQPGALNSDGTDIGAVELRGASVTITAGPDGGVIPGDRATFVFEGSRPDQAFECSLDGAPFSPCGSPLELRGLSEGEHTFSVRAVTSPDGVGGNTETRSFRVDTTVQGAKLKAKKSQEIKGDNVVVKVKASAKEVANVKAKGKIVVGNDKFKLKTVKKALLDVGKMKTLKLKLKKSSDADQVLDAIADGEKVKAKISGKFSDELGNTKKKKASSTLK
jgi:CSLREA domain-containing protein